MTDETAVAPEGATEEVATEAVEAEVETEGQVEDGQPPKGEEPQEEETPEGEKTESQKRRERKKAHLQRLKDEAAAAQEAVNRIKEAAKGDVEPKRGDFDDPDDYVAAKAAYMGSQAFAQREARAAQAQAEAAARQLSVEQQAAWREAQAEARTRHKDYDAVIGNPQLQVSEGLVTMIAQSETAGDLSYAVASDPAKALQLSRMNPVDAARELGRMEALLSVPKPKTKTAAPTPLKPVRGGGGQSVPNIDDMSPAEFRAWRAAGNG